MSKLELLIPPPVVALITAGAMWSVSPRLPVFDVPHGIRAATAIAIALGALCMDIASIVSFRRARTTINPVRPAAASALVISGVYAITRNPMYLGLVLLLIAWMVYLSSFWLSIGPLAFMLYINRFQIAPEEKALAAMFGASYADYQARVPRWL